MMLWKMQAEPFALASISSEPDGEGGEVVSIAYSMPFSGSIELVRQRATEADANRPGGFLSLTCDTELQFGDVVKRLSDGKSFKVASDVRKSHAAMSFSFWRCQVEEVLPIE